ncbi:tubulin epsilon chain-like isoform X1 [Belonocnema kinseyi]|uniref:tubulin epsilon chain-like isoform X1 n=1 Tax=Belonocnema kinseyi TaxID=2817044 RepID=UPI00143D6905|nr:tubulin epsilon chain-like isoform X1 [Belonocnema kinseyi]
MSQFITVQVGQCGNQIGSAFWPLVLHEYGIRTSESDINFLKTQKNYNKNTNELCDAFNSFFHVPNSNSDLAFKSVQELVSAKVKARAVLIDMEDSVVGRFKQGSLRNLFDQTCTVTNYPGSANNWAVGHYTHGAEYHDKICETIRKFVEKCDCLHGFLVMHSLGGGTGSGLGTATLKILDDNYPHVDRFVSCVYPAGTQDVITAPYNALLATKELTDHATCVFPTENKALQDICYAQMNRKENSDQAKYNASCRPFQDMNSIIVNMLLHLTSGSRFPGSLNTDMNELATNLVPYPQLHYIFSSVSPATLTAPTISITQKTKFQDELFTNAWSRNNQLIKVDPLQSESVVLGAAHILRGNASLTDIRKNIERFQSKARFTDWSKEAMKVGLCSVPPAGHPASVLSLINSTSMSLMIKDVVHQFDKLYKKKAHVHHYLQVENFEEDNFREARSTAINVYEGYTELQNQEAVNEPRLRLV